MAQKASQASSSQAMSIGCYAFPMAEPAMAEDDARTVLIEPDSRKRAALGRLAHHNRYLAREESDGTVVLTPAVVMPKLEADLLRADPAFAANLKEKMRHPERLRRRTLPSE